MQHMRNGMQANEPHDPIPTCSVHASHDVEMLLNSFCATVIEVKNVASRECKQVKMGLRKPFYKVLALVLS